MVCLSRWAQPDLVCVCVCVCVLALTALPALPLHWLMHYNSTNGGPCPSPCSVWLGLPLPWPHFTWPQITALRNLEALELGSTCDPASLQALTSLSGLRRLSLEGLVWMPGCLAHMPQLQQLELHCIADVEDDELQVLHLGLHALQQLTSLALDFRYCTRVPAAVAGLQRPQRCTLYMNPRAEDALPAPERRLAGGPWLGSLRWLGLCWAAALENIDVLAAAQRLEYLCLLDALDAKVMIADPAFPCRFWDWAATHQPLRCLAFEHTADDGPAPLHMFDAVLDLAVRRPGLLVRRTGRGDACCFCEEMLQLDGIPAA